jgi:hypothetical protein
VDRRTEMTRTEFKEMEEKEMEVIFSEERKDRDGN